MGLGAMSLGLLDPTLASARAADVAASPLSARPSHFRPRARRVVHFFLNGGPSHVDTFDPKPALAKYAGQQLPNENLRTERKTGAAFPSPFKFQPYGQSGLEISEVFSRTAQFADDIAVDAPGAGPLEALRGEQGRVRERVGKVEEERFILVGSDELHGFLGVAPGQPRLVGARFQELAATVEGGVPPCRILRDQGVGLLRLRLVRRVHVIRMHQPEVEVETMVERVVLRPVVRPGTEVPLAEEAGGVARGLEVFGQGDLRSRQAAGRSRA